MIAEKTITFKEDVEFGLSAMPKILHSKYFYDAIGDQLFVDIMHMPEYYLFRAEHDIFKNQTQKIIRQLQLQNTNYFELVELGAGDGTKTKELLRSLCKQGFDFSYVPIDISKNALTQLECALNDELPALKVVSKQGDYFEVLDALKENAVPKVVLFLGSNLGNMADENAENFIGRLCDALQENDKLLLGLDLIKSKNIVLPAYSDAAGITAQFNLNLLFRINKELGANFNLAAFQHLATYTESEGIARSYLVSKKEQEVTIAKLGKTFSFKKNERIHTENSRKYSDELLNGFIEKTAFEISGKLMDSKAYFADYILTKT